jgi:dinuclear metal center YbgI/SA1388 family protein
MACTLTQFVDVMHRLAPPHLAASWDNVGLLIEPAAPRPIRRVLLTIDLTDAVIDEALAAGVGAIVAYHPPIFSPLKRISARFSRLIQAGIAVYSPHTALDAADGGINDWLADGLGPGDRFPIEPSPLAPPSQRLKLVVFVPHPHVDVLRQELSAIGAGGIGAYTECSFNILGVGTFKGDETTHPTVGQRGQLERVDETRLEMICPDSPTFLRELTRVIHRVHPYEEPAWELHRLEPALSDRLGQGREVRLTDPADLPTLVARIKKHLKLKHVRLATPDGRKPGVKAQRVLVCAGAGGSVLAGRAADVYVTGEMRHHDVLAANAMGVSVILCDHTNTERGYLPVLKQRMTKLLGKEVRIDVSKADREPLKIV